MLGDAALSGVARPGDRPGSVPGRRSGAVGLFVFVLLFMLRLPKDMSPGVAGEDGLPKRGLDDGGGESRGTPVPAGEVAVKDGGEKEGFGDSCENEGFGDGCENEGLGDGCCCENRAALGDMKADRGEVLWFCIELFWFCIELFWFCVFHGVGAMGAIESAGGVAVLLS
jgi:hypothetical protein